MRKLSIIIGPPLSGKTTYVQGLSDREVIHISVGKICREEAKKDTELGHLIKESIEQNTFLDSKVFLLLLLNGRIEANGVEHILDGYPKYGHEVEPLVRYARENTVILFRIYHLRLEIDELLRRVQQRYTCSACYLPIRGNMQCVCGGSPFKREEDTEEYFMQRYSRYTEHEEVIMNQLPNHFLEVLRV
ncbi:MAG: nucleoside monophosphate kinase [Patescibacteria group bacterium]|jgi:adenylate kinase family enzyme